MADRSAHATIKGYFYQFDKTILELLNAVSANASVVVEGIEDIDLTDCAEDVLIQCKYYEETAFTPSVIKDAVIAMLKHFAAAGCPATQTLKYRIFGNYKSGQGSLPSPLKLDYLKKSLLTFKKEKVTHEVHEDLLLNDKQLGLFLKLLEINVNAPTYDKQQAAILKAMTSAIPGCLPDDAEAFFYPRAINAIQNLAVKKKMSQRKITKADFIAEINKKEIVFSRWLLAKFGDANYAKSLKRQHIRFLGTGVPVANRVFSIEFSGTVDLPRTIKMLKTTADYFSNKVSGTRPAHEWFCPFVLLRGISDQDLITLKAMLYHDQVCFEDGYPFLGADFRPERMQILPTKERKLTLKFIPSVEKLASCFNGGHIEVFDLFQSAPITASHRIRDSSHAEIPVPHPYFLAEIIHP
ncbi:DUF4297 family anti-phage-associated protein [Ferribacterium limneticum]|uniref:DUF4297 family anti-phage-associated protein n=1 Tax=Ferribacterium limneticum TaxID=76259 RepID=UPI001CF85F36|nr:DUF4297 family anti-phage-associated protein [Ferribacterium limneticum]UCV23692.1 hypothetical protein KI613_03900 [Ferribacterium limneticum]